MKNPYENLVYQGYSLEFKPKTSIDLAAMWRPLALLSGGLAVERFKARPGWVNVWDFIWLHVELYDLI